MALLDRVKERTGSDMSDSELQAMIDSVVAELDARLGSTGVVTMELGDLADPYSAGNSTLRLSRPLDASQAVTIVESSPGNSGDAMDNLTLEDGDYRVMHGGRTLQRLASGPNGRDCWAPLVRITYTPVGDTGGKAARDEAVIKLVHLDLTYRGGVKSERAGDYQFTLAGDVSAEREAIIAALGTRYGMVLA